MDVVVLHPLLSLRHVDCLWRITVVQTGSPIERFEGTENE